MSLEKRLKRHVIGPRHGFFAVTPPGLESLCRRELSGLSETMEIVSETRGGVLFLGKLVDMYTANLHLRTAGRILMRIADFPASNFRQLDRQITALPWELYLPPGAIPGVNTTCRHSRLYHSQAVARHVSDSIAACWQAIGTQAARSKGQTLFLRIENDQVTLSLDSSGTNLYRRGLKKHPGSAPLRETLAAGILYLAGYDPRRPLADPMCGSGTFALEAALMAKQIPPGRHRPFAFMQWPAFKARQWHYLLNQADQCTSPLPPPMIMASDQDAAACRQLAQCAARFELDDAITVRREDFFNPDDNSPLSSAPGLVVLNPPYGRRLKPQGDIRSFYTAIGRQLKRRYAGWRFALVVPHPGIADLIPFAAGRTPLVHGGLKLTLLSGEIPESQGSM